MSCRSFFSPFLLSLRSLVDDARSIVVEVLSISLSSIGDGVRWVITSLIANKEISCQIKQNSHRQIIDGCWCFFFRLLLTFARHIHSIFAWGCDQNRCMFLHKGDKVVFVRWSSSFVHRIVVYISLLSANMNTWRQMQLACERLKSHAYLSDIAWTELTNNQFENEIHFVWRKYCVQSIKCFNWWILLRQMFNWLQFCTRHEFYRVIRWSYNEKTWITYSSDETKTNRNYNMFACFRVLNAQQTNAVHRTMWIETRPFDDG